MATRVEAPQLVIPASTPIAAPVTQLLYAQRAEIEVIEIMVPAGPSGLVGFRFDHSSRQVIPAIDGTWFIADNETLRFPLALYSVQPDWHITAYNLDLYPHTLYVRLLLNDQTQNPASVADLITIE